MKKGIYLFFVFTCIIIATIYRGYSQPGSLDLSFDTDGMVTTAIGSFNDHGYSVAIQSDGKIVVAGYSHNGTNNDFALVRYNTDGSLDTTFDSDGKITTDFGGSYDSGYSVAIQSDGKIVVAGASNPDFALVRYNSDGSLDNTFDLDGKVTTDFVGNNDWGQSVAIQSDGKIVVAGYIYNTVFNSDFALVRYNSDGSLDTSFSSDGKVTTAIGSADDYGQFVTIQNDGKILVAGYSNNGSNYDFALVRYNDDGSLDTTFDTDGKLTTDFGSSDDRGSSVTIQSDGKIVVAGSRKNGSNNNSDFALVRYNSDGSLDNTFDSDGKVITDFGSLNDIGYSVAIPSDGKILVTGYSGAVGSADFALTRYNIDGSLDITFDTDGKIITDFGGFSDAGNSVAIQSDGKIVVAGSGYIGNTDFSLARYNNDIVGIEENNFENINIYPNPVIGEVTISVDKILYNVSMKLINTTGQIIMEQENLNGNSFTFDISDIANGIYYIQLKTENEFLSQKIIKQ